MEPGRRRQLSLLLARAILKEAKEAPRYEDYVKRQKETGQGTKILKKEEWEAKVFGQSPEKDKDIEPLDSKETKTEDSHPLSLSTPDENEIKTIREQAKDMAQRVKSGIGGAITNWLANRDAKQVKEQEEKATQAALENLDKETEEQNKKIEAELKKLKEKVAFEDSYNENYDQYLLDSKELEGRKPKKLSDMSEDEIKEEKDKYLSWLSLNPEQIKGANIRKKHGLVGFLKYKLSGKDPLTPEVLEKPRKLRLLLFGEEGVKKKAEKEMMKKVKKDQQKQIKTQLDALRGVAKDMEKVFAKSGFQAAGAQVRQTILAHVLANILKNVEKAAGASAGHAVSPQEQERQLLTTAVRHTVNPPDEVLESAMGDVESEEPLPGEKSKDHGKKIETGYQAYVNRKKEEGVPDSDILSREDWESIVGVSGGSLPDWASGETGKEKAKTALRLATRWFSSGPSTGNFFDDPEKREVRQLFESAAKGNMQKGDRALGAPPTFVEVRNETPRGDDFRTLARYLLETEQPSRSALGQSRIEVAWFGEERE